MPFEVVFPTAAYDEIRAAVDVSLDADALPDSVIEYTVYKGEAEARVRQLTAALSDAELLVHNADLQRAALLITAGLIAPRIRIIVRETLEGDDLQWQTHDLGKLSASLLESGIAVINRVLLVVNPAGAQMGITDVFGLAGAPLRRKGGDLTKRTGSGWGF